MYFTNANNLHVFIQVLSILFSTNNNNMVKLKSYFLNKANLLKIQARLFINFLFINNMLFSI